MGFNTWNKEAIEVSQEIEDPVQEYQEDIIPCAIMDIWSTNSKIS